MNLDAPFFHLLRRQLEVFRGYREGVVRGAVLFQSIFLYRIEPLEEHDHPVSGSKIGPIQVISHVVAV